MVAAYASKGFGGRPMKPGGIGWLGDQTLYSWMSVNGEMLEQEPAEAIRVYISCATQN